jgi:uncharacterized protein involved in response to NO
MMESPWQARTMLDSPHRLCFFWAGAQWLAAALWWLWLLAGDGAAAAVPVVPVHALWFGLGAMPLFIVGFLLTAGPRWLRAPAVAAADLRLGVATFSAGWLLTALGAGIDASLAAAGQLAAAAGLGLLVRRAWQLLRAGTRGDAGHARVIVASLLATALGLAASGLAMLSGHAAASGALGALAQAMLWWGPVAAFIAASHRMLPFLGDGLWPTLDRRLPLWPLWTLLSAAVAQGAIALARGFVTLPATLAALGAAHLGLVALASLALTLRWFGAPALRSPLVRMLHLALLWWPLALALLAAGQWPWTQGTPARAWQMAGLHALAIGYLTATWLVMVTRVIATHQGQARAIGRFEVALFGLLQAVAVARVLAALWPSTAGWLLPMAALAWAAVALLWWPHQALRLGRAVRRRPVPD